MSTLTGQRIRDTYDGLLKTTDSTQGLPTTGVVVVEDGLGNDSALSLGRTSAQINGDLEVDNDLLVDGDVQVESGITAADNIVAQGSVEGNSFKRGQVLINKFVTEQDRIATNDNDTSIPTSAAVKDHTSWAVPSYWGSGENQLPYAQNLTVGAQDNGGGYAKRTVYDQLKIRNYGDTLIEGYVGLRDYLVVNNNSGTERALQVKGGMHISNFGNLHIGYQFFPGRKADNCQNNLTIGNNHNFTTNSQFNLVTGNQNTIDRTNAGFIAGERNTLTRANSSGAIGTENLIDGTNVTENTTRSHAIGFNNSIYGYSSQAVGGYNDITTPQNGFAAGYNNHVYGQDNCFALGQSNIVGNENDTGIGCYAFGNQLNAQDREMVLGYRNNRGQYPQEDKNVGLSQVRFCVATGALNTHNALLITEGGINGGTSGDVPQIARVIMPTIVNFNYANDTEADNNGIPDGGIYHTNGVLKIKLG